MSAKLLNRIKTCQPVMHQDLRLARKETFCDRTENGIIWFLSVCHNISGWVRWHVLGFNEMLPSWRTCREINGQRLDIYIYICFSSFERRKDYKSKPYSLRSYAGFVFILVFISTHFWYGKKNLLTVCQKCFMANNNAPALTAIRILIANS